MSAAISTPKRSSVRASSLPTEPDSRCLRFEIKGEVIDYVYDPKLFKDFPGSRLFRPWPITNGGARANRTTLDHRR